MTEIDLMVARKVYNFWNRELIIGLLKRVLFCEDGQCGIVSQASDLQCGDRELKSVVRNTKTVE